MLLAAGLPEKKKRGRPKKGGDFLGTLKSIGRTSAPIAQEMGTKVILPVATDMGKQALSKYMSGSGLKNKRGRPKKAVIF